MPCEEYLRAPSDSVSTKENVSLNEIIMNPHSQVHVLVHLALGRVVDDWEAKLRDGVHGAVLGLLYIIARRLRRVAVRYYGYDMVQVICTISKPLSMSNAS